MDALGLVALTSIEINLAALILYKQDTNTDAAEAAEAAQNIIVV